MTNKLVTIPEAAAETGLNVNVVKQLVAEHKLSVVRQPGAKKLISLTELRRAAGLDQ